MDVLVRPCIVRVSVVLGILDSDNSGSAPDVTVTRFACP
jgi:hypothetical protein